MGGAAHSGEQAACHPVLAEDFAHLLAEDTSARWLRGQRLLITGASGLVANYLARYLCWLRTEAGVPLRLDLLVRNPHAARLNLPWMDSHQHEVRILPMREAAACAAEADWVFHAASPATAKACAADPQGLLDCNGRMLLELLEAADPVRLRGMVYFSSGEVYGSFPEETWPGEDELGGIDPLQARALYPLAKLLGESICHGCGRGLPVRVARIFHSYGPGMDLEGDPRIFAELVGNVVRGEVLRLRSSGQARRAFCYLSDTVAGLLRIARDGTAGHAYNLGNRNAVLSMRALADLLQQQFPERCPRLEIGADAPQAQSQSGNALPNTAKLEQLGWRAHVDPASGFRRTVESYF